MITFGLGCIQRPLFCSKKFNNVLKFHHMYILVPQFCFQMLRKSPLIYCVLFFFLDRWKVKSDFYGLWKHYVGFPDSSVGKESACNAGDSGSLPGSGRSPGEGKGYPLQYSSLENSMDCIVHGVAKSWTGLSDFHLHFMCLLNQITYWQGGSQSHILGKYFWWVTQWHVYYNDVEKKEGRRFLSFSR